MGGGYLHTSAHPPLEFRFPPPLEFRLGEAEPGCSRSLKAQRRHPGYRTLEFLMLAGEIIYDFLRSPERARLHAIFVCGDQSHLSAFVTLRLPEGQSSSALLCCPNITAIELKRQRVDRDFPHHKCQLSLAGLVTHRAVLIDLCLWASCRKTDFTSTWECCLCRGRKLERPTIRRASRMNTLITTVQIIRDKARESYRCDFAAHVRRKWTTFPLPAASFLSPNTKRCAGRIQPAGTSMRFRSEEASPHVVSSPAET